MKDIALGIVGFGGIGIEHAKNVLSGKVPGLRLAAVANRTRSRMDLLDDLGGEGVERFTDYKDMLRGNLIDAVLIATPHPAHFAQGMDAFEAGKHVLMEKPACLESDEARMLVRASIEAKRVYAMMFNKRADPALRAMKELLLSANLGAVRRLNCISTGWFRAQCYYDSCAWRGTWSGEGGGVLVNQAAHTIDTIVWLAGLPVSVHAHCHEGKWHDIEVEDDVTAYMEYENGATGVFVSTTGDAPGIQRIDITLEGGTLLYEDGKLTLKRLESTLSQFTREYRSGYGQPSHESLDLTPREAEVSGHIIIMRDFVEAIRSASRPIADGADGYRQVLLSNSIHLSSWLGKSVQPLNLDWELYKKMLGEKIASSRPKAQTGKVLDTSSAFKTL
ncbi:MAG: Gfo/Idh/MocA family oxidoreductase [Clostridia bacterium]|nr:Gfo/Idh/MocA family oxidoreductase [Clostridia bacterium]